MMIGSSGSYAESAFGPLDNELTQSITSAIKTRWNMPSNA